MDTMHESVVATGYFMHEGVPSNAPFLTPKAVLASAQAFADALQQAYKQACPCPAQTQKCKVSESRGSCGRFH